METLEREQRETAAKSDYLLSHLAGGRVLLDTVARLSKALPAEIRLRDMKMADPGAKRDGRGRGGDDDERTRVAFTARRRGLVIGEVEVSTEQELRLRGQGESFHDDDVVDGLKQGVIKWPAFGRAIILTGEVDENVRGGRREALNALKDQLTDASRGVRVTGPNLKASDKPGWTQFEFIITFE